MRDKLTPDDVNGQTAVLTIATAERRNFAPEGREPKYKLVLTFDEFQGDGKDVRAKEYVVNATSYKTLVAKLGDDEAEWPGLSCVMAPTTTGYDGKAYEKLHVASPDRWDKVMQKQRRTADAPARKR